MSENAALVLNRADFSERQLADRLRGLSGETQIKLADLKSQPLLTGLGAGLDQEIHIEVDGSVGDFLFLLGANASFDVRGNVGDCCGHSMVSGGVVVHGNAGNFTGCYASSGFIAVLGNAGNRCGQGLAGADVLVRSTVGDEAGYGMRNGALVLGNGAGERLGEGMSGGVIFVRGNVKSIADGVRAVRLKDADSLRLSLLLARAGIKAGGAEFLAFRTKAKQN